MIRYFLLWYGAKTYCPVIDSLSTEPEAWLEASAYRTYKNKDWKPKHRYENAPNLNLGYSSIYHKDLDIEVENWNYSSLRQTATRNKHTLPVNKHRLRAAMRARIVYFENKRKAEAIAELNRITQDAQTLRLARIVQLRKELAQQEAADFAHRLEYND